MIKKAVKYSFKYKIYQLILVEFSSNNCILNKCWLFAILEDFVVYPVCKKFGN